MGLSARCEVSQWKVVMVFPSFLLERWAGWMHRASQCLLWISYWARTSHAEIPKSKGFRMLSWVLIARMTLFLCESLTIQMFILPCASCFTRGLAVFREVTHTEHQGQRSLGKFQTLRSALSLLTDVALQFYLSSLKAFLPFWIIEWDPFDSVGVLKLFSSALAALAGIHGFSIVFLLCHAMQPLFPCHSLTGRAVTASSCLYIQLSSASSSCLFGSILPISSGFFTHLRSKDWGKSGKQGKEQGGAGGEMRWGRGKSRDNNGVGKQWKDPGGEGND